MEQELKPEVQEVPTEKTAEDYEKEIIMLNSQLRTLYHEVKSLKIYKALFEQTATTIDIIAKGVDLFRSTVTTAAEVLNAKEKD